MGLVCYSLFYSAKTHVEAVQVADELVVKTDSLGKTVNVLHKEKETALEQIQFLDSTLVVKEQVIDRQKMNLTTLRRDAAVLKRVGPIIIHDTVYVTETKSFWGKKKKTVETVSSTDTLDLQQSGPGPFELDSDTMQLDSDTLQ
jgi:hypothetical protein